MNRMLIALLLAACSQPPEAMTPAAPERPAPMFDKADGADDPIQSPWGGPNPGSWTPEAVLANAAERALAEPGTLRVAIPVKMLGSAVFPFGDGQSNASVVLPWWSAPRPPVVARLLDSGTVVLRFDRDLGLSGTIAVQLEDQAPTVLTLESTAEGDSIAEWDGTFDPQQERLIVRPEGWADAFPISFHHPVRSAEALAESVPESLRPDGPLPDAASVAMRAQRLGIAPVDVLADHGAGPGYNAAPFLTQQVHAQVPGRTTAVGGARTWLTEAPFKQLYICLDGRNPVAEAQTGAPSGAGWHAIGDPAESLLNTVADAPILVGWAQSEVFARDEWDFAFGEGQPAYELTDIATFSRLQPGQTLVTGAPYDHAPAVYHWYAVHTPEPLCTEVWVHPCGLDDSQTFACRPAPVQFQVHDAHTQPGENIFLVGDHPALGEWDPAQAVPLSPANYPSWHALVPLPPGTPLRFKFIRKNAQGQVTWMGGADLEWTVPHAPTAYFDTAWIP
jgi:hypothetical protein